jgi:hypothetical protein
MLGNERRLRRSSGSCGTLNARYQKKTARMNARPQARQADQAAGSGA